VLIEASGGLTDRNIADFMCPGQRWMWHRCMSLPCLPERLDVCAYMRARVAPDCIQVSTQSIMSSLDAAVDVLSTSWVHQGVPHIDFSLKIQQK
jgi:nicotinate-nucleotide pyrophosphorylase